MEERRLLANTLYVDAASPGPTHDGTSWGNAYADLQAALGVAASGDTVLVAQGTYEPTTTTNRNSAFQMKSGVGIFGGYAGYTAGNPDARNVATYPSILSGDIGTIGSNADNSYHVVVSNNTDSTSILDGFTITAGNASGGYPSYVGGGLFISSGSPTIRNCTLQGNTATHFGGGLYISGATGAIAAPTIIDCKFIGNSSSISGGGIYNSTSSLPAFINCVLVGNTAVYGGGGMLNGSGSSSTLTNCTFTGNSVTDPSGAGGGLSINATTTLTNSIIWGNTAAIQPQVFQAGSTNITYSDVQGGWAGTGNINTDPLFVRNPSPGPDGIWGTTDDDYGDLHLQAPSPVADAGNNNTPGLSGITTDLGGGPRFLDIPSTPDTGAGTAPIVDMGAYEAAPALAASAGGPYFVIEGQPLTLSGLGASTVAGTLTYAWDWDGDNKFDESTSPNPQFPTTSQPLGTPLTVSLRVTDSASNSIVGTSTVTIMPPVFYVAAGTVGGSGNGTSWANAFTSLHTALTQAVAGQEIHVAGGVYKPTTTTDRTISFQLKDGVTVLGGYAGATDPTARNVALHPTILSGDIGVAGNYTDNTYHVVVGSGTNNTAILDGFTITAGNAGTDNGGGMVNSSGSPTIRNCTFSNNAASGGGGIQNYTSSPTLINCVFSGNSASSSGGGMYTDSFSSPTLINCTFSGNSATNGSALYDIGAPTLTNCIVWGNIQASGPQISGTTTVTHSDIQGGWAGAGNINADPQFIRNPNAGPDGQWGTADDDRGDLRLLTTSPCIDAGSNAAVPGGITTDQAGNPRIHNGIVDMGAFESNGVAWTLLSIGNATVVEGGSTPTYLTVSLSAPAVNTMTVAYATANGTATAPGDYTTTGGTVTFNPGDTSKTINIQPWIVDDQMYELSQAFYVILSSPANDPIAVRTGTVTIQDNDPLPTVSISNSSVHVSNSGTTPMSFTVTLSAPSGVTTTVQYATADGTAIAPTDYTSASGTITFNPGEISKIIQVLVAGNTLIEPDKTFTVTLTGPTNATLAGAPATGTIINDNIPNLSIGNVTIIKGSSQVTNLTVTLSTIFTKTVTVSYATADGTAVAPGDYTTHSGSLTFNPGDTTKTIDVHSWIVNDPNNSPDMTFSVILSSPTNATINTGTGSVTIQDHAAPTLSISNASIVKGSPAVTNLTVTLSAASDQTVTVNYATADGTAVAPTDYTSANGMLTFNPGETTKTLDIHTWVLDSQVRTGDKTFSVVLSSPANATLATGTGTVTIQDHPLPTLSIDNVTIVEGSSVATRLTITLSAASTQPVSIQYAPVNGTASSPSDYSGFSGSFTFNPGETTKTINIQPWIVDDNRHESNRAFSVVLSSPTNATIASGTGTVTIQENDPVPAITISDLATLEGNSGTKAMVFTVTLSAASGESVSVNYATANGTALVTRDYLAASGTITFNPGQTSKTISVSIKGNTIVQSNRTIKLNLTSPTNATLARAQAIGTIIDDDGPKVPQIVVAQVTPATTLKSGQSAAVSFGSAHVGATGTSLVFRVTNMGSANLALGKVVIPAGYQLMKGLPTSLAPGKSDTFTIKLLTKKAGKYSGAVSFTNNTTAKTFRFPITGTVTA